MASTAPDKTPPLWFSNEQFADYWTTLTFRVRQHEECDQLFTGAMKHPLIDLQRETQKQILDYRLTLVSEEKLKQEPFQPTEFLLAAIKVAAQESDADPPLSNGWSEFHKAWAKYKQTQHAIAVATLKVGSSSYALCALRPI